MTIMKTYSLENINYSFNRSTRKWHFCVDNVQFIMSCPGGKNTADAVAKLVLGSVRRTKHPKIDGIARKAIDSLMEAVETEEN